MLPMYSNQAQILEKLVLRDKIILECVNLENNKTAVYSLKPNISSAEPRLSKIFLDFLRIKESAYQEHIAVYRSGVMFETFTFPCF